MLELDACTRCQECVAACPVVRAGIPDGAMERIDAWRGAGSRSTGLVPRFPRIISPGPGLPPLFESLVRCTTCGICSVVCESGISTTSLWESMRGACRELGFRDAAIERTADVIDQMKNPYAMSSDTRTAWIPADTKVADSAPVGFFAGCTVAFRQPELGRAALRILAQSKTAFCMLGKSESCCGSFLFRTGSLGEYPSTILAMIEDFRERGVKTVLFPCAGCLKTATLDWPRVYGRPLPFKTMPFSVFMRDLIRENKIRFSFHQSRRVIYHDPCHGGRHLVHHLGKDWVFEAPRNIISAIPGFELVEFPENREFAVCCGAGGGVKTGDPGLAQTIAHEKIDSLSRIRADLLASTCPFCRRNLDDARITAGSTIEVLDVIELVDRMMDRDVHT
ncbi:MAG: (Fe-S)-binding protein [Methanomicrobiales archaeon]